MLKIARTGKALLVGVIASVGLLCCASPVDGADWRQWRGPHQNGHFTAGRIPVEWDAGSVRWKTPLPGRGQSSPVTCGDRLFLTAALDRGRERLVMGLHRERGEILWKRTAWTGDPQPSHEMNGWASSTCATDGRRVYAFFGKGGLHCYTVEGQHVWSRDLGDFPGPWGTAASPILVRDLVIQNCDSDGDAYVIALDKRTGETVWRADRPDFRGWSTPVLLEVDDREELALNGHTGVDAYNPETGERLWYFRGFEGRGTPTVTPGPSGLLHVANGRRPYTYALRPGGDGNVSETHLVWKQNRKGGRDLPSPIVIGDVMLLVNLRPGVLTAYRTGTGEELWKARMPGKYSATPIAFNGMAYFINEAGVTSVVRPGEQMTLVARNDLQPPPEEIFRSAITPDAGRLFIRSDRSLYCIDKSSAPAGAGR